MSGHLEVDRRNQDLPIPVEKEPYRYQGQTLLQPPIFEVSPFSPTQKEVAPDGPRGRRFPRSTLPLSIALALMTLLAILAAAIGGSIAAKRGNEVSHLNHLLAQSKQSCPSAQAENSTSSPDLSTSLKPSTNCTSMSSGTYATTLSHDTFKVSCDTDLPGHDMLGVWVYTFADCMEACNSWNLHKEANDTACYAVAYDAPSVNKMYTQASGLGNCWLKREKGIKEVAGSNVSSGLYQFKS